MKWEIDTDNSCLTLNGDYHISFERLTEIDWFEHLSEKNWVDMRDLLSAFVAAYDYADLQLSEDFFSRHKRAFFRRSEYDYTSSLLNVWNDKIGGRSKLETASDLSNWIFSSNSNLVSDLVSGLGRHGFSKSDILSAIYRIGNAEYSDQTVSRAITAVTSELERCMFSKESIFEHYRHEWLRIPNCGLKTVDLIEKSLASLSGSDYLAARRAVGL